MLELFQIGIVAQRTGFSVDAIRFYEKRGLVKAANRSEGGFRLFRAKDVENLQFIRGAQKLDFSLDEIRELLALRNRAPEQCLRVERLLERKLNSVQQEITTLRVLEAELREALGKCQRALNLRRPQEKAECPIFDQVSGGPRFVQGK